eukprot:359258-Chlamydomonas_euryale.AAC.30
MVPCKVSERRPRKVVLILACSAVHKISAIMHKYECSPHSRGCTGDRAGKLSHEAYETSQKHDITNIMIIITPTPTQTQSQLQYGMSARDIAVTTHHCMLLGKRSKACGATSSGKTESLGDIRHSKYFVRMQPRWLGNV